ncbi:DUF397 domain-containing protein [Dactylosporangium sp. NPDC005555]|uniref:DUF397 domain-containing protein n=1 Tax=Dactylosporangium sp. NPDC005555 TaxID=3154889 RepID=UPI0033BCB281
MSWQVSGRNEVPHSAAPLVWRKSKACASNACVEVAEQANEFFVRDSKSPMDSAVLSFDRAAWAGFISGLRTGSLEPS